MVSQQMTAQVFLENNRKKGSGILDDRFISKTTDIGFTGYKAGKAQNSHEAAGSQERILTLTF